MQKIALIPAYCPEDRMTLLVEALHRRNFTVVVIDDGSGEAYDAAFDSIRQYADVRRYQPNRGKGEALKCGLRYIDQHFQPPYTVVTADADGQHRVVDIVSVCDTAGEHPDALALGKRLLDTSSPIKSRIGNGLTRFFYRLIAGRSIYETQTGLRAFSDRLLPRFLKLPGSRYEYEIDMMLSACDLDIIEVPIQTVYFDNNAASHFRPLKDTVKLNAEFIRFKLPSLIAGAVGLLLFTILAMCMDTWLIPCIAARLLTILLQYVLDLCFSFSEKVPIGRYVITSLMILLCDLAVIGALSVIGTPPFAAKLIACVLMTAVGVVLRTWFQHRKFKS